MAEEKHGCGAVLSNKGSAGNSYKWSSKQESASEWLPDLVLLKG